MFRLTLKELGAKKLRLLTTALAVMLGVAFMAGTLVLTATISRSFDNLFADAYSGTDAYVRGVAAIDDGYGQTPRLDDSIVATIAAVDGVAEAAPRISGYAQIVDAAGDPIGDPGMGAPTFGENWVDTKANPYTIVSGHAPAGAGQVAIDRHSADTGDFDIGDRITVLTKAGPGQFELTGIAKFGSDGSMGGASTVLFTTAEAQALVAEPGQIDAVSVVADPGVSQETVTARIAATLPSGAEVLTGDEITTETQKDVQEGLSFFNIFLLVFAGIALFVGAFIIYNTFAIIVTQRQKEMALLRAIGASGRQVVRSVLIEAIIVGLLASLAGLAAGIGVAKLLQKLLDMIGLDLPAGGLVITSSAVILSLIVGTVVTTASAYFPARRAGRVPPIAAMREVALDRSGTSRKRAVIATSVTAAGVASIFAGLSGDALGLVGLGALLAFVGVTALAPILARPAARLLGWPMHRVTKMSGSLARQNAMRNPKRTAATAAALTIGVALVGFIATFAASTKGSINQAVDQDFHGDYVIDSGSIGTGGISHDFAVELAARPEFEAVTSSRFMNAEMDGVTDLVQSWDTADLTTLLDIDLSDGNVATLGGDGIALLDDYALEHGWTLGSQVPITFAQGSTTLTVEAIYGDETWTGSAFVDHAVPASLGADELDSVLYVGVADGTDAGAARATLDTLAADYATAEVLDRGEFKEDRAGQIDTLINLIYALLGLAIIIALMGITNTLALSIFERTRELGLLRAIGMTRSELRATVRWEAMIIAVFGTLLGLGLGVFFGWSLVQALSDQGISVLVIPGTTLAVVTAIAAVSGVLASVLPARRAARLDVLGAIASQ